MMNGHAKTNGSAAPAPAPVLGGGADDEAWARKFLPPPLVLDDMERARKVEEVVSGLVLDGRALRRVAAVFERELRAGLRKQPSSLQMENTYVPDLPDGTEKGVFLALDLGGTNFRVLLVELQGGQLLRQDVKQYHISDELRLGPGEALFSFLAESVHDFLRVEGLEHEELSLGFTFSFPMRHHSISSGELITWTKSFNCGGMAGVDVAALLQRRLAARGLRVRVQVLLNDTTGTLVAGALHDRDVAIGVILGTGSNGCYLERASNVVWETAGSGGAEGDAAVVVDVEWGAFGDNGCLDFLRTDIDDQVDTCSLLAGSFTFEKYIGGKYLGDVASACLQRLHAAGALPAAPAHLGHDAHAVLTQHLSQFEEENEAGQTALTLAILKTVCRAGSGAALGAQDALVAQHVSRVITTRAAQLASVCVSTLIRRMGRAHCSVAIDGSVYKRHPRIKALMQRYIALLAPDHPFTLVAAEDGSGKGSALTAAIAARLSARAH